MLEIIYYIIGITVGISILAVEGILGYALFLKSKQKNKYLSERGLKK